MPGEVQQALREFLRTRPPVTALARGQATCFCVRCGRRWRVDISLAALVLVLGASTAGAAPGDKPTLTLRPSSAAPGEAFRASGLPNVKSCSSRSSTLDGEGEEGNTPPRMERAIPAGTER